MTSPAPPATAAAGVGPAPGWFTPAWSNWRLALLVAAVVLPASALALPTEWAFWPVLAAVSLVALTLVVNAWGRHRGGALVAPALALLFLEAYRADPQAPAAGSPSSSTAPTVRRPRSSPASRTTRGSSPTPPSGTGYRRRRWWSS